MSWQRGPNLPALPAYEQGGGSARTETSFPKKCRVGVSKNVKPQVRGVIRGPILPNLPRAAEDSPAQNFPGKVSDHPGAENEARHPRRSTRFRNSHG
jgi:hypothetical protein